MKLILLYKDTANPNGLPGEWPSDNYDDDGRTINPPWFRCTESELVARLAQYQSQYDAWFAQHSKPVPEIVSPWQIRKWLRRNGIAPESIPAMIASILPSGLSRDEALDGWEYSQIIEHSNPLVQIVAAQLGKNIDDVFREASLL